MTEGTVTHNFYLLTVRPLNWFIHSSLGKWRLEIKLFFATADDGLLFVNFLYLILTSISPLALSYTNQKRCYDQPPYSVKPKGSSTVTPSSTDPAQSPVVPRVVLAPCPPFADWSFVPPKELLWGWLVDWFTMLFGETLVFKRWRIIIRRTLPAK